MSSLNAAGALPAPLTSDNLRRLGHSLIRPMPPVSISSSDDNKPTKDNHDEHQEHQEAKILRLQTWIYNAMQTLVGLGAEGLEILVQDELIISGLGQVGPRPHCASDVDINNVAYLERKLAYLVAKCKPLSQERRRRRRGASRAEAMAEDEARALAETEAIEGSSFGNMRGGAPGAGPSLAQHTPHSNGAYPAVYAGGLHGGSQDDGKSYYYETLRRYLKAFLSNVEAEALLNENACCDADSRKTCAHDPGIAVLADTAPMQNRLRGDYLKKQGKYITANLKLQSHTPLVQELRRSALRDLPCPFSFYMRVPAWELFDLWAVLRILPQEHVLYSQYKLAQNPMLDVEGPYPKEYLDLVEARQGAMFRLWLSVAPERVRIALQTGDPSEQVFVCRLLGAALLDENKATRTMNALCSRSTPWSLRAAKFVPTALDTAVEEWLDGLPMPDVRKGADGYMHVHMPTPMLQYDASACVCDGSAGTHNPSPARPASSGSNCSLQEISAEEFSRKRGSGLNPLAPSFVPQTEVYQRGGEMDEMDEMGEMGELDEPDESDEPEMPPAKRTKCLDLHDHPSLQHDQSVHPPSGAVKTEQTIDTPTPLAAAYTSATDTPQSSASSAPTLNAAMSEDSKGGKGKEKKEEKIEEVSATGKSMLGKRPYHSS